MHESLVFIIPWLSILIRSVVTDSDFFASIDINFVNDLVILDSQEVCSVRSDQVT